ncbi:MAG TPA: RsmD family RNA methyltransferase [Myxococcota bacterium]|nr:RsmD family RNA methyltransferase [Myxococcota bacterium]
MPALRGVPRAVTTPPGLRIIAGSARGTRLAAPPGDAVRPTGARAREALFSVLTSRGALGAAPPPLVGANDAADGTGTGAGAGAPAPWVLDLFAGTGALGLEALSRGAARAWLVEQRPEVAALARENARRARLAERAHVVQAAVAAFLRSPPDALRGPAPRVGLAFLDPPYDAAGVLSAALADLAGSGLLAPGATVVAERRHGTDPPAAPAGWETDDERRWGEAAVTFYNVLGVRA